MNGVVSALTRRGVRAIELFGREDAAEEAEEPAGLPRCLLPANFARAVGFEDVAPHHLCPPGQLSSHVRPVTVRIDGLVAQHFPEFAPGSLP